MMKKNVKIFVVSLKSQSDRRLFLKEQFEKYRLSFDFFDAINPSEDPSMLDYFNLAKSEDVNGRKLSNGEIGCSLSHYFIYKEVARGCEDYAMIIEDDALINEHINDFLNNIINVKQKWDIIILGYSKISKKYYYKINKFNPIGNIIYTDANVKIGKVIKESTCGTVGYLITKEGAKKMLSLNLGGNILADNWPYFKKNGNLEIFHCRPFLVYEDFENFKSSIEDERFSLNNFSDSSKNIFFDMMRYLRGYIRKIILISKK